MCIRFFFFKQKTAYEIMPSLVGSEMCIRDRKIKKQDLDGAFYADWRLRPHTQEKKFKPSKSSCEGNGANFSLYLPLPLLVPNFLGYRFQDGTLHRLQLIMSNDPNVFI
eukprot:TRINITY_DN12904_c0_g1_i1.p1 TRINITY_DN12904_c0_g1~~TRINITY_DN12904_c0_g1_i1.p1  ORF type:complete len:109 (+),score=13.98 TRINITY_DN12904_c0_g1_i1:1-327(+)